MNCEYLLFSEILKKFRIYRPVHSCFRTNRDTLLLTDEAER